MEAAHEIMMGDELKPRARASLKALMSHFARWRELHRAQEVGHGALVELVLEESGYLDMLQKEGTQEAQNRIDNVKEMIKTLGEFPDLQSFLEHVSLVMETTQMEREVGVFLMTLHAAKGLEFEVVFLPGWEEGLFPSSRTLDESGLTGLEEERRLAYVGLTRAGNRAEIYFATHRRLYGSWQETLPSRFVRELSLEHLELSEPHLENILYSQSSSFNDEKGDDEKRSDRDHEGDAKAHSGYSSSYRPAGSSFSRSRASLPPSVSSRNFSPASAIKPPAGSSYKEGDLILHSQFGQGLVVAVEGDKLTIHFDNGGKRKVLDRFVQKAPLR